MKIFSRQYGEGLPIVLLHGFCETHEIWDGFDKKLSKFGKVISIDLPGFGKSNMPDEPVSIDSVAQQILAWLKESISDPIMIVGHSLGGYVALAMAELDPNYCRRLVLFHSTIYADTEEKKANRDKVIEFVASHGVAPFLQTFVPSLFANKQHAQVGRVKTICNHTTPKALISYALAMKNRPSRQSFVSTFSNPILILAGEKDEVIPMEISRSIPPLNPKISLISLPEAAHMGMIESEEEALKALIGFI